MLSVEKITPAQGADYYKAENYYSKEEAKKQSQWSGQGAAKLKLQGAVEGKAFKNLLDGYSPERSQLLTGKANQKDHRAAYDCTFSAPKSVSLAVLMGGQEQLIEAHRSAVSKTLEIIEQQYAQARVWDGERQHRVTTGNLIVAQFHHTTSREKDPQLHTHCLLLNCTQREDGRWRSLSNEELYRNKMLLGAIYRNELAQECRKLGYEIEKRPDELFEIKGYTQQQLDWYSKRRQHILKLVGPDATAEEKQWAALYQRPPKGKELPREQLVGWWQAQDEALELKLQHPIPQQQLPPEFAPATEVNPNAAAAVSVAIEHCSERAVAFKRQAVEKFVLAEIQDFSYAELQRAIAQSPELIQTFDQRYTTQTALDRELATIRMMQQGKGQLAAIADPEIVEDHLETELARLAQAGKRLTQGQQEALRLVATTTDQFTAWCGVAGAGKTYSLQLLKTIAQTQGFTVRGFAPSGEAAKVLGKELDIQANTVASLLLSKQPDPTPPKQLWIVDEAGLLNAKDGYKLLLRAKEEEARIVMVGDIRQMSAVEAGSPFRSLLSAGIAAAQMNESLRQKTPELKRAADLAAAGYHAQALSHLSTVGKIQSLPDQDNRTEAMAQAYLKYNTQERKKCLILVGTHKEKAQLMGRIREGQKAEGSLSQEDIQVVRLKSKDLTTVQTRYAHNYEVGNVVVPVREYKRTGLHKSTPYYVAAIYPDKLLLSDLSGNQLLVDPMKFRKTVYQQENLDLAVGDRLKWTKTDKELGHTNGEEFVVTALETRTATLQYEDGKTESLFLDQPLHLDYAIVSTTYSAQGKTADRALISSTVDSTISQESTYVAISRTRYDLKIFAEDIDFLMQQAQQSKKQDNPLEVLNPPYAEIVNSRGMEYGSVDQESHHRNPGTDSRSEGLETKPGRTVETAGGDLATELKRLAHELSDRIERGHEVEAALRLGGSINRLEQQLERIQSQAHRRAGCQSTANRLNQTTNQLGRAALIQELAGHVRHWQEQKQLDDTQLRDTFREVLTQLQEINQTKHHLPRHLATNLAQTLSELHTEEAISGSHLSQAIAQISEQLQRVQQKLLLPEQAVNFPALGQEQSISQPSVGANTEPTQQPAVKEATERQRKPIPTPKKLQPLIPGNERQVPPPSHITEKHWRELIEDSAIHPALASLNVETLKGNGVYERLLSTKLEQIGGSGQYVTQPAANLMRAYAPVAEGGWWAKAGIDARSLPTLNPGEKPDLKLWGSFKPDSPRLDAAKSQRKGKTEPIKYEHPLGEERQLFLFDIPNELQEHIYNRHSIQPTDAEKQSGFWSVVYQYNLPITITEGAKKTLSSLSQGEITIGLSGVNGGYATKDQDKNPLEQRRLHPELQVFATPGREFRFAFDHDTKSSTICNVRRDLVRTGELLEQEGCSARVVLWKGDKGLDDLIVNQGPQAYAQAQANSIPLALEAKKHYRSEYTRLSRKVRQTHPNLSGEVVDTEVYKLAQKGDFRDGARVLAQSTQIRSLREGRPKQESNEQEQTSIASPALSPTQLPSQITPANHQEQPHEQRESKPSQAQNSPDNQAEQIEQPMRMSVLPSVDEALQRADIQQTLDEYRLKYEVRLIKQSDNQSIREGEASPFRLGQDLYDKLVDHLQDADLAMSVFERSLEGLKTLDVTDKVARRRMYEELAAKVKRLPEFEQAEAIKIDQGIATFAKYHYGPQSVPEILAVSNTALNLKLNLPPKEAAEQVELYIQRVTQPVNVKQFRHQRNWQQSSER